MAYTPIAFTAPNYRDYGQWWAKAYIPGTTTPKSMATDSTLSTLIAKAQVNADGFFVSAGSTLIIPYIDGLYDLWLFPTAEDADNNNTISALRLADNLTGGFNEDALDAALIADLSQTYNFDTVSLYKTSTITFPVGKRIYLEDRNAYFTKITGIGTANTYNIIASTSVDQSIELNVYDAVYLDQIGAAGDGVVTGGVSSGTDDVAAINIALEYRLPVIGNASKLYYITATRVRSNASNEMRDVHLLAANNLDTGLELGWMSGDSSSSTTLTGADLIIGDRIVEVSDASGIEAGQLITLKSTKVWPYDTPRNIKWGETNVIDSISGNFITLVSPLSNTFQLGTETVSVLTYQYCQQRLNNVSVEYGEPIEKGGISIQFSQNPILIDVTCKNTTSAGLNLSGCWMAAVVRPLFIDCWLTGGATGYGMQENNCAWSTIVGLKSSGCRRGYDASGTYPTRYSLVDDFHITGELTGTSGSGVGTHSGAQAITFSNGKVDGADIGVQIRGPNCVIDNVDCFLNPTPISLTYTLACTIQNCKQDSKYTSGSTGSVGAFPARFIDIGQLPDDLSSREKLIVQNNRATTRLDFIKINPSLNDGIKYATIKNNYSNLLTNSSGNTINFFNAGSAGAMSECVVLGNTFETNAHTGTKHFYNPNLTISTAAPNALQNVDLSGSNVVQTSGAGTVVINSTTLRWDSDGEYCHVYGELEFIVSVDTVKMKVTGMQQKKDGSTALDVDLGVQMGGLFDGVWSDTLITKSNREDIFLAFEGFRTSRDRQEPFPIGVHAIPVDIRFPVRFPMNK